MEKREKQPPCPSPVREAEDLEEEQSSKRTSLLHGTGHSNSEKKSVISCDCKHQENLKTCPGFSPRQKLGHRAKGRKKKEALSSSVMSTHIGPHTMMTAEQIRIYPNMN